MEPDILLALLKAKGVTMKAARDAEIETRDELSSLNVMTLNLLFPGVSGEFQAANFNVANELARATGELIDAVAAARTNWTGTNDDDVIEREFSSDLIKMLATDYLVAGKIALYPRIDDAGQFALEVPTGYLLPIFRSSNALKVDAVLQVVYDDVTLKYNVNRFAIGNVDAYPPVADWLTFASTTPTPYAQAHAPDRLPLAFKVVRRDAHRQPYGLVAEALGAYRRYLKTAVNRNAVQDVAGFPERVVKSDTYLKMALGQYGPSTTAASNQAALDSLRTVGPAKFKIIGKDDTYDVTKGVDLAPHMNAEETDKGALLDALRSPSLDGGNVTEVALAERQSKKRDLINAMCSAISDLFNDALALAAKLPGSQVPDGVTVTLTPSYASDAKAKTTAAADLYSKGGLKKSQLWLELQNIGWNSITDVDVEAAQATEGVDGVPIMGGA